MGRTKLEDIPVRWTDAETGEDFTDRMYDPSVPPGEGILKLAGALGRLMAARQLAREQELSRLMLNEARQAAALARDGQAEPPKLTYNIREAVQATGLSVRAIHRMWADGELEIFRFQGRTLIRADVLQAALDKIRADALTRPGIETTPKA